MKKKIFIVLLFVGSCSLFANTNLVGLYNFTDPDYLDLDLSGNLKNLTFNGSPVYDEDTKVLVFDGVNDYATTSINPVGSFSLSMWVKPASTVNCDIIRSTTGPRGYAVVMVNGSFRVYVYGNEYSVLQTGVMAEVGKWYHIAVVFEDNGLPPVSGIYEGTTKVYVDGVLKIEAPDYYQPISSSVTYIGTSTASSGFYSGSIKELAISKGALIPSQVAMLATGLYSPIDVANQNSNCITAELPYSYYPFADPNDLSVSAKDFGTNKSNLTFYGSPEGSDGYLTFDGTNDYATAVINPAGSFSISLWIKADTLPENVYPKQAGIIRAGSGRRGYMIRYAQNAIRAHVYGDDYNSMNFTYSPANLLGKWCHIGLTFEADGEPRGDGTYAGTSKLYVDGVFKAEDTADTYLPHVGSITYIATDAGGTKDYFDGIIDDLAVWNRVLADDEMAALASRAALPLDLSKSINVADFNADCKVNLLDFAILADQWLSSAIR